jgi:hypothetical protein
LNNKPINEEQIKFAINLINQNPKILIDLQFTPEMLSKLLDKNINFASEIYIAISTNEIFQE